MWLQSVVDDWIGEYKHDASTGLVRLIQLIVTSCGCKSTITRMMIESVQFEDVIKRITDEHEDDTYPLVAGGVQWKKFRTNLEEFFKVRLCFTWCSVG